MKIVSITELPSDLEDLIFNSEIEGFAFINRLASEWVKHLNRFENTGEFLLISSSRNKTIGICGINIDPYFSDPEVVMRILAHSDHSF